MEDSVTIDTLRDALTERTRDATFSCGGTLTANHEMPALRPLFIQYEAQMGEIRQITFPASEEEIATLAADCELATFGVLGEAKLDLTYRSAWKMDTNRFQTSFHPSDSGIMEVIKRILFPGAVDDEYMQSYIVAELYKLNVVLCYTFPFAYYRFTRGRMTSSSLMSTRLALRINLDL